VVLVTGVSGTGVVGQVTVWGNIVPIPTGPWTPISTSDSQTWTPISTSDTQVWTPIAA